MDQKGNIKWGLWLFLLFNLAFDLQGQVSYGGSPIYKYELSPDLESCAKELHFAASQQQLKSLEQYSKGQALTFAHQYTVNYTPDNSGTWTTLEDGTKVWRLLISSPGAFTINLIFDRYRLPEGGKLFIYNTDYSDMIGAFTSENNMTSGVLPTAPVRGDEVVVEYQEPKDVPFHGELLIGAVNHDFLGFYDLGSLKYGIFGESGSCNEDISCYDADNQLDIRRSVVRMLVGGVDYCTGTMINNTNNDGTPYMITAAHCMKEDAAGSTTLLFFNYESPHCAVIDGSNLQTLGTSSQSITGGETKVLVDSLDIALLKMEERPPAYYRPYYAGWTLSSSPSAPFVSIHHPQGDVKKISTFSGELEASTYNFLSNSPYAQVDNFHWRVSEWTTGATERGSSGCPIFDANNLLVGTLSGGQAYCGNPINDYFTQFYKAWDKNTEENAHFKSWLDPQNLGAQSLEGLDPYADNPFVRISNVETGDDAIDSDVTVDGYLAGHNVMQATMFAEKFTGIKSAIIKGIYMMPCDYKYGSGQTVDVMVWQGSESPQTLLSKKEDISIGSLTKNKEVYLELDDPVEVTGSFFVGYEINYEGSPIDSFALYVSVADSKVNNTMWVYHSSTGWEKAADVYDNSMHYSLWLDVLAESVVYGDTQVVLSEEKELVLYHLPGVKDAIY